MPVTIEITESGWVPPLMRFGQIATNRCHLCEISEVASCDPANSDVSGLSEWARRFCAPCWGIMELHCAECRTVGVRAGREPYRMRSVIASSMRRRFMDAYGNHEFSHRTQEFIWQMACEFASRIAGDDFIFSNEFWNLDDDVTPIIHTDDGHGMCDDCVHFCDGCHGTFRFVEYRDGESICETCAMPTCNECGERWEDEYEAQLCCNENVHSYDFRPAFRFWTMENGDPIWNWRGNASQIFLGMELETEDGMDSFPDFLRDANETGDEPNFCYGKRDGSLDDSGVELVTMPATLDAFAHVFPWDALAQWNRKGARSFHRSNCGFHVHVSRAYFSPTHLWRFVAFQMRNQRLCESIAQRNSSRWARWQTLSDLPDEIDATLTDVVKGKANGERYVAINFTNRETVELRYFRGNLRRAGIMLRMEFVHAMVIHTETLSAGDVMRGALTARAFAQFVKENASHYPTLLGWMTDNETMWEDA